MELVNRYAVVLKPKKPFADWVNEHAEASGTSIPLDHMRTECHVYLFPEYPHPEQIMEHLRRTHKELFEFELWSWCADKKRWPRKTDWRTFQQWFDIELHSMVIDLVGGMIVKEAM